MNKLREIVASNAVVVLLAGIAVCLGTAGLTGIAYAFGSDGDDTVVTNPEGVTVTPEMIAAESGNPAVTGKPVVPARRPPHTSPSSEDGGTGLEVEL